MNLSCTCLTKLLLRHHLPKNCIVHKLQDLPTKTHCRLSSQRTSLMPTAVKAPVVWINGFPGTGKKTIADAMKQLDPNILVLDNHKLIDPVAAAFSREHPEYNTTTKISTGISAEIRTSSLQSRPPRRLYRYIPPRCHHPANAHTH
jgi:hypothetical protein